MKEEKKKVSNVLSAGLSALEQRGGTAVVTFRAEVRSAAGAAAAPLPLLPFVLLLVCFTGLAGAAG